MGLASSHNLVMPVAGVAFKDAKRSSKLSACIRVISSMIAVALRVHFHDWSRTS